MGSTLKDRLVTKVNYAENYFWRRFWKRYIISSAILTSLMLFAGWGLVEAYADSKPVVMYNKSIPPILVKISKCESGGTHFDKNGQVVINATRDIGKYQINVPIWGKKAKEMGLDLSKEKDNEAFALWLFENKGSAPWVHSSKCWLD